TEDDSGQEQSKENQAKSASARIIRQAEQQAEEIVSSARAAATQEQNTIRANANAEAKRITSEAREAAYKEGMDAATREGDAIKAEARQTLESAVAERKAMQESLEPEIVELIIGITDKLLDKAVAINPSVITNLIKQGLASAVITGDIIIYVSPQDLEQVQEHKDELVALADGSVKMEIVKDLSLNPMDCVIETPFGDIDCSLGQQYDQLKANLSYILNNK
ncbi:MAG: FliH/SctL family protein, partial [Defluviitaleaceae bacterium]|nr:FliH/SctL family protein [Defluviitaleaceae bacterium]